MFRAVVESRKELAIGANGDQNGVTPAVLPDSAVINLPRLLTMVCSARARKPMFRVFASGVQNGGVLVAIDLAVPDRVRTTVRPTLDNVRNFVTSGGRARPASWRCPALEL